MSVSLVLLHGHMEMGCWDISMHRRGQALSDVYLITVTLGSEAPMYLQTHAPAPCGPRLVTDLPKSLVSNLPAGYRLP